MSGAIWGRGDPYERYVGRWSRVVAREFLAWLARPAGGAWLDVGCGTGALTEAVLRDASPASVTGVDPAAGFVAHARAALGGATGDGVALRFGVADARALPFGAGAFDVAVSGLVLNFVPEPERALAELRRVVRAGGTVAAYVWDYAGEMQLMRRFWDAAMELDPAARTLAESLRFALCSPPVLRERFEGGGLRDVEVRAIDAPTVFLDFDDYWEPFLGGQGPAPAYAVSLDEERRARLRERLRATLPARPDGSIPLIARAWAVRGTRA